MMEPRQFYHFLRLSNQHHIKPLVFLSLGHNILTRMFTELRDDEIVTLLQARQNGLSTDKILTRIHEHIKHHQYEHDKVIDRLNYVRQSYANDPKYVILNYRHSRFDQLLGSDDPKLGTLIDRFYVATVQDITNDAGHVYRNQLVIHTWEYWSNILSLRVTIHYSLIDETIPNDYVWVCCHLENPYHPPGPCCLNPDVPSMTT
jgi:hypothetical protein